MIIFVKQQLRTMEILILLLAMLVSTAKRASADDSRRQLQQQSLIYRANYTAEFQYWRSTTCDGDAPILQVSCFGQGMSTPNTSDTTIVCTKLQESRVPNGTTYECRNTCNETTTSACTDIYLAEESSLILFSSIRFLCESDDVQEVEASLVYLGGNNNGTCAASVSDNSFNVHVARLGISCPVGSGTSRGYVYDDTYFECESLSPFSLDYALPTDPDIYVCISGDTCGASQACNFAFDDLFVRAELPRFLDSSCIETALSEITPFPTGSPTVSTSASSLDYSARFEASWAIRYNSEASIADCDSANPTILVVCNNDSRIQFVTATDVSMNCTEISIDQLQCMGDPSAITNQFTSVFFVSGLYSVSWIHILDDIQFLSYSNTQNQLHCFSWTVSLFRTVSDLGYPRHALRILELRPFAKVTLYLRRSNIPLLWECIVTYVQIIRTSSWICTLNVPSPFTNLITWEEKPRGSTILAVDTHAVHLRNLHQVHPPLHHKLRRALS
jgi:hypothetical protein